MRQLIALLIISAFLFSLTPAYADINYVEGYTRKDGTYVSGHYRDTSNDGDPYNNANYLGYNS